MPTGVGSHGGPPEMEDAIKDYFSYDDLPTCGIWRLLFKGRGEHNDYTWGFRIYRTTYKRPDSDARFAKAIEVLNEYVRFTCFSADVNRPKTVPPADDKASEQLWQRLRHDIVEDHELLEGASETPAKILELAQNWVHLDRKATTGDSPRYRFFLVIDDEVIDHLIRLPMPASASSPLNIPAVYSVKVYDAQHNSPVEFSGGESDSESDADSEGVEYSYEDWIVETFEGWFWSPVSHLAELWFCEYQTPFEELLTTDDSWGATQRLVPGTFASYHMLPLSERRLELYASKGGKR